MTQLTKYLHNAISRPCYERPFVFEGFPDSCEVMIIGENPATKLGVDWWSFWDDESGFNLASFELYYQSCREASGKTPVSSTRKRLNRFRSKGLRCLETNAYSNERLGGHDNGVSNRKLLQMLTKHLDGLVAVLAHGKVAETMLDYLEIPIHVRQYRLAHFIRVSFAELDEIAIDLLEVIHSRRGAP